VANTQAAISAYAEAYGAGVADDVRLLLFALYWEDGVDIGNPNALRTPLAAPILRGSSLSDPLRRFGHAVSVARGPITTSAWRRIRAWRSEWQQLGPHDTGAPLDLLIDPLQRVRRPSLLLARLRERREGRTASFASSISGPIFGNDTARRSRTSSQVACTASGSG
jgi:hypothetical protein